MAGTCLAKQLICTKEELITGGLMDQRITLGGKFYPETSGGGSFGDLIGQPYYNSLYQSVEPFPNPDVDAVGNSEGFETWCTPFGNSDNVAANMKQLRGLPSRAIRNTTWTDPTTSINHSASYMDFSAVLDTPRIEQ